MGRRARRSKGTLDRAHDVVALPDLFAEFGPVLEGKHPFLADKLDLLPTLVATLVQNVRPGDAIAGIAKRSHETIRQATPDDRLLSPRALKVGLKEASVERGDALKNEYPRLQPLLEGVREFRSPFKGTELERLWEPTSREVFPRDDSLVQQLESIGLLKRKQSKEYDYGIASRYIDGLAVKRIQGQTK